jgi:hypothetical protein
LVDDLTLKDVKTRLAHWLVQRCPDPASNQPCQVQLPMTKHMLASELGTGSETLSRTLATFRNQKLLSVAGRTITLLCPSKLARSFGYSLRQSAPRAGECAGGANPNEQGVDYLAEERRKMSGRTNRSVLAAA